MQTAHPEAKGQPSTPSETGLDASVSFPPDATALSVDTNLKTDGPDSQQTVEATLRHLASLTSAARTALAGLASLVVLLYVVGYIALDGYYGSFNADWLTNEVSLRKIAGFGIQPLALFGFITFFVLCRLLEPSKRFFSVAGILGNLFWFAAIASMLVGYVMHFKGGQLFNPAYTSWVLLVFYLGMFAEFARKILRPRTFGYDLLTFKIVSGVVFIGLVLSHFYGNAVGSVDSKPGLSKLPIVELKDSPEEHWRLLTPLNERLALVKFGDHKNQPYMVRIVEAKDVAVLRAPRGEEMKPDKPRGPVWPWKIAHSEVSGNEKKWENPSKLNR